jgi:hypothetical protein
MRPFMTPAILVAGVLVACTSSPGREGDEPAPSPSPTATATRTATATAVPTTDETASPTVSPAPSGALGDATECENEELGYEVDYPGDWWANERIEPEGDLTPIPACQYFAPTGVELQPNAGLPSGIAIRFEIPDQEIDPAEGEVLSQDDTTVDGRDALIVETEPAPQPGFVPEGSHVYRYIVELSDGRQLVATTDDILQDGARYEDAKAILDAMMETLDIDD